MTIWDIKKIFQKIKKMLDENTFACYNKYRSERTDNKCGCSSSGRAPPCQGGGSEFEPRHPLQILKTLLYDSVFFCFIYKTAG